MRKAFTIIELLVALSLFAAVIAAAGMIFNYSLESQRIASATAEIMRTLRSITDQINIDFQGLQKDGYLILYSQQVNPPDDTNNVDALYYFSTGDYQSWDDTTIRSNIARIFLGHSRSTYEQLPRLPGNLARDVRLLTPGQSGTDYNDVSLADCQTDVNNLEDTSFIFTSTRPLADSVNIGSFFSQNVGSFKIEWTYGWVRQGVPNQIVWWSLNNSLAAETVDLITREGISIDAAQRSQIVTAINETPNAGPPPTYSVEWTPTNQQYWPKALKFTFTLYDSKRILKGGRTFEYIVYVGQ